MSRVFIPEMLNSRFDLSSAKRYGELVPLSDERLKPFDPQGCCDTLWAALNVQGYDNYEDFICLTGHTLIVGLVMATVLANRDTVRFLMFDAKNKEYCERVMHLPCYLEGEDLER